MISTILLTVQPLPNYAGVMYVMSEKTRTLESLLHMGLFEDAASLLEQMCRDEVFRAMYESEMTPLWSFCWEYISIQPGGVTVN